MFDFTVLRRAATAVLLTASAALPLQSALAGAAVSQNTDQPLWRATHGLLTSVTHAGNRMVAVGDRGIVLLSDDQGATWRLAPSGTTELLTAVLFTSATDGFAVGQDSTILHTADAGAHWKIQTTAAGNDQALFSVASLGANHLIATGAYALIQETTDGGANWSPVKLPNLDEDYHLNCVMGDGPDVVITGEAGHAFVRHGGTWIPKPVPYEGSLFGCLTRADGAIYTFGLRGSLFAATPAAPAWKRIDTGEQRSIFGGTTLSSGFMALVGGNGLMMLFDPQTNQLRRLPPVSGATLSSVAEAPNGHWVVVGEDGAHIVDPTATSAAESEVTQ